MKLLKLHLLPVLVLGLNACGGGSGDDTPSQPTVDSGSRAPHGYKMTLNIDQNDLQALQNVKYASNGGAGISTPDNFKK